MSVEEGINQSKSNEPDPPKSRAWSLEGVCGGDSVAKGAIARRRLDVSVGKKNGASGS